MAGKGFINPFYLFVNKENIGIKTCNEGLNEWDQGYQPNWEETLENKASFTFQVMGIESTIFVENFGFQLW